MKIKITRFLAIILLITGLGFSQSITAEAQTVAEARIITVDFTRVTTESLVGQDVSAQLESNRVTLEGRASELDAALSAEGQELERQRNIVTPAVLEEGVRVWNQNKLSAQNLLNTLQNQHQRAAQQASLEIQRTLRPIVMQLMEEHGATIVLDRSHVYHSVGGLDITTEVIDRLDSVLSSFQVTLPSN